MLVMILTTLDLSQRLNLKKISTLQSWINSQVISKNTGLHGPDNKTKERCEINCDIRPHRLSSFVASY